MKEIECKAPFGTYRIVRVSLSDGKSFLVDDVAKMSVAYSIADEHNCNRSSDTDDIYRVYDDLGQYLRGLEAAPRRLKK